MYNIYIIYIHTYRQFKTSSLCTNQDRRYSCIHVCVYVCMYVCMYVHDHAHIHTYIHTYMMYIYIYIYIYIHISTYMYTQLSKTVCMNTYGTCMYMPEVACFLHYKVRVSVVLVFAPDFISASVDLCFLRQSLEQRPLHLVCTPKCAEKVYCEGKVYR